MHLTYDSLGTEWIHFAGKESIEEGANMAASVQNVDALQDEFTGI